MNCIEPTRRKNKHWQHNLSVKKMHLLHCRLALKKSPFAPIGSNVSHNKDIFMLLSMFLVLPGVKGFIFSLNVSSSMRITTPECFKEVALPQLSCGELVAPFN